MNTENEVINKIQNYLCGMNLLDDFKPGILCSKTGTAVSKLAKMYFVNSEEGIGDLINNKILPEIDKHIEIDDITHKLHRDKSELVSLLPKIKYTVIDGKVIVDGRWYRNNICTISIPQLKHCTKNWETIKINVAIKEQTIKCFEELESLGLHKKILSYGGSYVPRFIRGSSTKLSNHAIGTAMDFNMKWNLLGRAPAPIGTEGSLLELTHTFNKYGFFHGAFYKNRKDAMHFEALYVVRDQNK